MNMSTFAVSFGFLSLFYPILRHRISNNLLNCLLKCLPMSFLIGTLALQHQNNKKSNTYSRNILLGLLCSTIGDAFLAYTHVCRHSLMGGIIAFGIAHVFYISAFGLQPFKMSGAAIVVTVQVLAFIILRGELSKMGTIYLVVVPIYMGLLLVMAWRASVGTGESGKIREWRKMGGISFVISDTILAFTEITGLVKIPGTVATLLILSTYYFSQYCIAKTALRSKSK